MEDQFVRVDGKVAKVLKRQRHGVYLLLMVGTGQTIERVGSELSKVTPEEAYSLRVYGSWMC